MAKKKQKKVEVNNKFDSEILKYIYVGLLVLIALVGILEVGFVGEFISKCSKYLFGYFNSIAFAIMFAIAIMIVIKKSIKDIPFRYLLGSIFVIVALVLSAGSHASAVGFDVFNEFIDNSGKIFSGEIVTNNGFIGALLYSTLSFLFGYMGTIIFVIVLVCISLFLFLSEGVVDSIRRSKDKVADKFSRNKNKEFDLEDLEDDYEEEVVEDEKMVIRELTHEELEEKYLKKESKVVEVEPESTGPFINISNYSNNTVNNNKEIIEPITNVTTIQDFDKYSIPKLNLLVEPVKKGKNSANTTAANIAANKIINVLSQFGINCELIGVHIGPSVTKFEIKPDSSIRVNKIENLQQNLKMELAAKDIRIEAPIPGKQAVGIEIPNVEKTTVFMKDLLKKLPADLQKEKLVVALGKDLSGNSVYCTLNKMPHLLIAGSTGSGKSVCINTIITSLLMRTRPDQVKMLLIDPKKVEFTPYRNVPHLLGPVISEPHEASNALKVIVNMMEERYDVFAMASVRNIEGYNQYVKDNPQDKLKPLPWIVVIIDELADLMLVAAKEVEASIQRITQLARAAGIHLIVATQRPSVDVITGVIKANIPSRIAFAVSSLVDSRTILDQSGAERLLGYGDMLYLPTGQTAMTRVQGAFVSEKEVSSVTNHVAKQGRPKFEDAFIRLKTLDANSKNTSDCNDPLYDEVKTFVIQSRKASTSFIQRKFSVGYSRAARLIDMLEEDGIIGPGRGSKPREILVNKIDES